jgi:sensor c-di-GMP phosphodiesterase-like protein
VNKRSATVLMVTAALIAVAAPILISLYLAEKQARDGASDLALAYARDVVHRSDTTADQVWRGFTQLRREARRSGPCSAASQQLMRRIAIASSYIDVIGHVSGTRLDCASVDVNGGIELGPVEAVQPTGVKLRYNVELPLAPQSHFIVIETDGYAAMVHKALPINVTLSTRDLSLAIFTTSGRLLTARGYIDPRWIPLAEKDLRERTFIGARHIVAIVPSKHHFIGGIAALPISRVTAGMRSAALLLLPVGICAGIVLALAVWYLMRLQLAMPAVIKAALKRNEFLMLYQPIVDLQTGRWVGAEALMRWRRPNGEMVRPDLFIPVAEDAGLMPFMTRRAIDCVTRDARMVFERDPDFHLAINLSAADLQSEETVQLVRHLLHETGARRGSIVLEVTERGFSEPQLARPIVRELRAAGTRVAVDDFGTGYSSLSYLETFELDLLKIDRSFIDSIGTQAPTSQVVVHIIEMAKALHLETIAEGVETHAQVEFLRARGVKYAQGWLFGKPMPLAELVRKVPEAGDIAAAEVLQPTGGRVKPAVA